MSKDYYIILGVSSDAALVKIKRAYRRAVKRYHPDVTSTREGAEKFKQIKEAYETLQDEEKRRSYDEALAKERSPLRITEVPSLVNVSKINISGNTVCVRLNTRRSAFHRPNRVGLPDRI